MTTSGDPPSAEVAPLAAEDMLEQLQVAVIATDRDGRIEYYNRSAEQLFGYDARKVVGCSVMDLLIAEEDHDDARALARDVLRGHRWAGTFCNVRSDGVRLFTRAEAVPRRGPSGWVVGTTILAREALTGGNWEYEYRLSLLDKLGGLLAQSLGFDATLRKITDYLIPQFAEHCFVDLYDEDGNLRRYALRHADSCLPASEAWVKLGDVVDYAKGHFYEHAIEREESVLIEDLRRRKVDRLSSRGYDLCTQAGVRSVLAEPLKARGELLGAITLVRSEYGGRTGACFDADDQSLARAIATRIAVAVDNARLFEEERETALGFQKGLLPRELPRLDGLSTAHHYEPAEPRVEGGVQTQAGGDWYDLIPLSAGRVGIVIGDVQGRGARSAAIMSQLRSAVHAFAQFDLGPAEMLKRLEKWVRSLGINSVRYRDETMGDTPLVSCMYLVYDAWSRHLCYANAGHEAPVVVDGTARDLEVEQGPSLGVSSDVLPVQLPQEQTCVLPPGATLLLYTNGLVERRPEDFGGDAHRALRERAAEIAGEGVQEFARDILGAVPGGIDDDVAVLVLRTQVEDLDVEEHRLDADPAMVAEARRKTADALEGWSVPEEQAHLACLLVSEVVTNAVRHAMVTPSPRGSPEDSFLDAAATMFDDDSDAWEALSLPEEASPAEQEPAPEPHDAASAQGLVLRLRRGEFAVWAEVFDRDLRQPRIKVADEDDEGGRGLYLVERLSTRWGSRPTRDGKWVWFELAL